ncbi:hypothetical protein SLA2020_512940 [Shorea laevis]
MISVLRNRRERSGGAISRGDGNKQRMTHVYRYHGDCLFVWRSGKEGEMLGRLCGTQRRMLWGQLVIKTTPARVPVDALLLLLQPIIDNVQKRVAFYTRNPCP